MATTEEINKHQEDLIATMDAVTRRLYNNKKNGKKLFQKGLETLNRKMKFVDFMKFDDAAIFFYKSMIYYKTCSQWSHAGHSLINCAEMHVKATLFSEAAALYTEAAELLIKDDITEAIKTYKIAIQIYCDIGRFDIAGRLERLVALKGF
jgi:hypothetical protein